jgi:hypothetical protein
MKPQKPTLEFFKRYASRYSFGFWLDRTGTGNPNTLRKAGSLDFVELNINPRDFQRRDPIATSVTITQGGGKYIERRGGPLVIFSISGTTGYLPPTKATVAPHGINLDSLQRARGANFGESKDVNRLYNESQAAENARAERSGFAAFHKLRYLFRTFLELSEDGDTTTKLHFFNVKDDDFWEIEPEDFSLNRVANQGPLYTYSISFKGIAPSGAKPAFTGPEALRSSGRSGGSALGSAASFKTSALDLRPDQLTIHGVKFVPSHFPEIARVAERVAGLRLNGLKAAKLLVGKVATTFQGVLGYLGDVLQLIHNVADLGRMQMDAILTVLKLLHTTIDSVFDTIDRLAPRKINEEVNEFMLEALTLVSHMQAHFVGLYGAQAPQDLARLEASFSTARHVQGSTSDLLAETGTPLALNPFLGASGLGLMTDTRALQANAVRSETVYRGETLYDVAQRLLGSPTRFLDLIVLNNLEAPYIVADAAAKPPRTLAWGENILVPDASGAAVARVEGGNSAVPSTRGTVSAEGTATELIDSAQAEPWRVDQWVGYTLTMLDGAAFDAEDNERLVIANDETTLTLQRAWTTEPEVGDSYQITLEQFEANPLLSQEARVFGKDLLLVFRPRDGSTHTPPVADIRLNARRDLALVRGKQNFTQAMTLLMYTERGRHTFHPDYGIPMPVGERWDESLLLLYTFLVRQSILEDTRVARVAKPQLALEAGIISFQVEVEPVGVKAPSLFKIAV